MVLLAVFKKLSVDNILLSTDNIPYLSYLILYLFTANIYLPTIIFLHKMTIIYTIIHQLPLENRKNETRMSMNSIHFANMFRDFHIY
jgi:hypothetical protein